MSANLGVSIKECKDILNEFFKMFPNIKEFTEYNEKCAIEKGYVEDYMGRRRHLPDAGLDEIEVKATKKVLTSADVFFECDNKDAVIDIPDEELTQLWTRKWAEYRDSKRFNSKKDFKELAKSNGIPLQDNGAFISKTMTQCTNARIQGCLDAYTLIKTKEFGETFIYLLSRKEITVWDGGEWSKAVVLPSGKKKKCKLVAGKKGYAPRTVYCSPDHKFKTTEGVFTKLADLKIGDLVAINTNFGEMYLPIIDVQQTEELVDMYDVCNTERGYFVANDFITHNSAATLTKKAMVAIANDPQMEEYGFRLLIPVHDELLGECKAEYAEQATKRLTELMVNAALPECTVKMKCDAYCVKHWYADEVANQVHDSYLQYITGDKEKGVEPMTPAESFAKICSEFSEISSSVLREMCNNTFDVLSERL